MPSHIGHTLSVSVFGQSHSAAIGCVIEGIPAGFKLDQEALAQFMARRAPGCAKWSTPRRELDQFNIVSGLNSQGKSCGAPFCAYIQNTNTRSGDYATMLEVPRPGHADFTAEAKFNGAQDVAGGGHFSGRLTACLCIAGGIAQQLLASVGIHVSAHLYSVGSVQDEELCWRDNTPQGRALLQDQLHTLQALHEQEVAEGTQLLTTLSPATRAAMEAEIADARTHQDSIGGSIECVAVGLPAGVGSPMFEGLENLYAQALFGIPAVKGVEFGEGFDAAKSRGSQNNDPFAIQDSSHEVYPLTNHAGGILGGISSGACVRMRVAIKPTPSIAQEQQSVNMRTQEATTLSIRGRHDPCIVGRACAVVEAVASFVTLDALLSFDESAWFMNRFREATAHGEA